MSLTELLAEVRQRRLILTWSRRGRVVLWAPNTHVPRTIRSAIALHNQELQRLINRSEIAVCPSPELHRRYWTYAIKRYCCDMCARLLPEVST